MPETQQIPVSIEQCRQLIADKIFAVSSSEYKEKYPKWRGQVGLEVEMLPVVPVPEKVTPRSLSLQGKGQALAKYLKNLADAKGWTCEKTKDEPSMLMRVAMDHGDFLTFEPGGQLEFSSKPYPCLDSAVKRLYSVQKMLSDFLESQGTYLLQIGCNPWHTAEEVGLQMPKARYRAMNDYFATISDSGADMMRLTCTVQVCLDFGETEELMAKRYFVSQVLSPFATAIFCNSPFRHGKPTEFKSYRSTVWQKLDPSRTGFVGDLDFLSKNFTKDSCVDAYTNFLLDSRVVFIEKLNYEVPTGELTFREWINTSYKGLSPDGYDLETQISLLFPEVRPRGFMELRSIDSQMKTWQIVPAAFYLGLLYDESNVDWIIDTMRPHLSKMGDLLKKSSYGMQDDFIWDFSKALMERAIAGFSKMPSCFLDEGSLEKIEIFNKRFTEKRRTPADDLLEKYNLNGKLSCEMFHSVANEWQDLFNK